MEFDLSLKLLDELEEVKAFVESVSRDLKMELWRQDFLWEIQATPQLTTA